MNKVIKIEDETVYVGKGDNGQFTAISRKSFGFEPQVGDYVEFYQNGDEYIVSKIDNTSPASSSQHSNGVINLNWPQHYLPYFQEHLVDTIFTSEILNKDTSVSA